MLIIVEGPDGAGKSTLVRALVDHVTRHTHDRVVTYHAGPPKLHPLDEYVTPLVSYRPNRGETVICDRWHWGEWVYPSLVERSTKFDAAVSRYTELFLHSRGAVVLFVDPGWNQVRVWLTERGDDLADPRHTERATVAFQRVHRTLTTLPTFRATTRVATDVIARTIVSMAQRRELSASLLNSFVTYVGTPDPRYLLVGERRNVVENHQPPAFMPYPATSGHFLLSHYRSLGDDRTIALVNACDVDDPLAVWRALPRLPIVVALGREACVRLCALGVPHGSAPHPQFVRRFHHRSGETYCRVINDALYGQLDLSSWREGAAWQR